MSFWESELGPVTGDSADAFAKSFTQIPDGTMALARVEMFVNAEHNGSKYLNITWVLTDGDFRGAKVEQKLKVWGDTQAKDSAKARHRALNMLKLMYQLYNLKPKHANDPTDLDLAVFIGKSAGIKIRETEPNKDGRQYNWVAEIHEAKGFKSETGISLVGTHTNPQPAQGTMDSAFSRNGSTAALDAMADDIPF